MSTKQEVESVGLTELELLEAAFDEELRCESKHTYPGNETCSVEVTCIVSSCEDRFFACRKHEISCSGFRSYMMCSDCRRPASDCWKIIPI